MQPLVRKRIVLALVIVLIVQTVVFLAITIAWRRKRNFDDVANRICSPCTDLLSLRDHNGKTEDIVASMKQATSNTICCGGAGRVIKLALRKTTVDFYFDQTIQVPVPSKYVICNTQQNTVPQARLTGIVSTFPKLGSHRVYWTKNGDTFTTPGIMHLEQEGEVFIRKPGYYLVSSQLRLMSSSNKTAATEDEGQDGIFSQFIYLTSHQTGLTGVISERRHSLPLGYQESTCFTSILKAVYQFDEYDRVSVAVSHPQLVVLGDTNSTFTAFYTHD